MLAVAGLVPHGTRVCDVGCDHGFVAIYLIEERRCPKVIAMDIHQGPLLQARKHIEERGLSLYIETRLSDGVAALEAGEADCMVAAGMGGRLIVKIMEEGMEKIRRMQYLVLQPQSEIPFVRHYLRAQGFPIQKEDMVYEEGKFYPMMLAGVGNSAARPMPSGILENCDSYEGEEGGICRESLEDEFGPCLIREKHPVLLEYLSWWEKLQNNIIKEVSGHPGRKAQVEEELARIRAVREWMQGEAPL